MSLLHTEHIGESDQHQEEKTHTYTEQINWHLQQLRINTTKDFMTLSFIYMFCSVISQHAQVRHDKQDVNWYEEIQKMSANS